MELHYAAQCGMGIKGSPLSETYGYYGRRTRSVHVSRIGPSLNHLEDFLGLVIHSDEAEGKVFPTVPFTFLQVS